MSLKWFINESVVAEKIKGIFFQQVRKVVGEYQVLSCPTKVRIKIYNTSKMIKQRFKKRYPNNDTGFFNIQNNSKYGWDKDLQIWATELKV